MNQLRKDYQYVKSVLDWDCEPDIQEIHEDLLLGNITISEVLRDRIVYILTEKPTDLSSGDSGGYGTVYNRGDNTKVLKDDKRLNRIRNRYLVTHNM